MEKVTGALNQAIFEDDEGKVKAYEELLISNIDEAADIPGFYQIPIENLIKIVKESKTENVKTIIKIAENINEYNPDDANSLLSFIDIEDAQLSDYVEIISNFIKIPVCKRIHDILMRDKTLPKRDYEGEIKDLKNKIAFLQKDHEKIYFPKVTEQPKDFESKICDAASEGKLTSVIYLIDTLHRNVESTDKYNNTPLSKAAWSGRIEIVKYLVEECHANVEAKNESGMTPLSMAAYQGRSDVVKYLVEKCHANINVQSKNKFTPLGFASKTGFIGVTKYLVENGAMVNDFVIKNASKDSEIQGILREHKK